MRSLLLLGLGSLLVSCTHTINFRANHFATPVTADQQWSGHASGVASGETKVTLVNDVTTTPPTRTNVAINQNFEVVDMMGFNNISADVRLNVWEGFEAFLDGSLLGLRFQFLNHGAKDNVWVAALHGAFADRTESTSKTSSGVASTASSKISTTQAGLSLGYKFTDVVPYVSYINENHSVVTNVVNGTTNYGPYNDKGVHDYTSVGLTSFKAGFHYAFEYSMINILWDRGEKAYQNAVGFKMGFAW